MHVTTIFQITKDSLKDNSCMPLQSETPLRSDGGTVYYQLLGYSLHAEGILFLMDCVVRHEVTTGMMWSIHTCYDIGPQSKLRKEIGAWRTCVAYIFRPR